MFLSVFDLFKIGIGPSSSHTMGPMTAAAMFLDDIKAQGLTPDHLRASLHGSLAFTGVGHASDRAVILGLAGQRPFDEDRLALMATDTDAVVIEGVYRKFNALELGGLLVGLEKLGHKTWCL